MKWLDIHDFILPAHPAVSSSMAQCDGAPVAEQLPLFEHAHTPYDDLDAKPHILDVDA